VCCLKQHSVGHAQCSRIAARPHPTEMLTCCRVLRLRYSRRCCCSFCFASCVSCLLALKMNGATGPAGASGTLEGPGILPGWLLLLWCSWTSCCSDDSCVDSESARHRSSCNACCSSEMWAVAAWWRASASLCVFVCMCVCMCVFVCVSVCICVCMCACVCNCVCMCVCVCKR